MSMDQSALLNGQHDIHRRIAHAMTNLRKQGADNITLDAVRTRIRILDDLWAKFESNHDLIRACYRDLYTESEYYKTDFFDTVENAYVHQHSLLTTCANTLKAASPRVPAGPEQSSEHAPKTSLPRIQLPRFSGTYEEWPPFRDLFLSVIGENSSISNIERFHYLRSCLQGPAEKLIHSLTVTGNNYDRAWAILSTHYENKKELIRSNFATFTAVAKMKTVTADELSRVHNAVTSAVNAQESIGRPIDSHGMDLFNHFVVELFDPRTRLEWESSSGGSVEPLNHDTLMNFITKQILTLNAAYPKNIVNTASEPSRSAKTHLAKRTEPSQCPLCNREHSLMGCPDFKAKQASERKTVAETNKLCFNCLGNHPVAKCQSTRNCMTCNSRHHTMLHDAYVFEPKPAAEVSALSAVGKADDRKAILLVTPRVIVADRREEPHEVRALIDHLWNLGYDYLLRIALLPGCWLNGFADDTFLGVEGDTWDEALRKANVAVRAVVATMREMGLMVAPQKTQAVFFYPAVGKIRDRRGRYVSRKRGGIYDKSAERPPAAHINVEGTRIVVGASMKVLGLWLDGNWSFGEHFTRLTPRATGVANSLARLMPNLGGASGRARRLYAATVQAVTLYGAPVWASVAERSRPIQAKLRRIQRVVALRVSRSYCTVSHPAATALAGLPPLVLAARQYAEVHRRVRALQAGGAAINLPRARVAIRHQEKMALVERWKNYLEDPTLFGRRTIDAIRPCLADWLSSRRYGLSYHSVQVLTGHGCFGGYLCRIGKEATTACHHCDGEEDTAQHTLESCPAGLPLADPRFAANDPVELLLGAEVCSAILEDGLRRGKPQTPIAQKTTLGWILSGGCGATSLLGHRSSLHAHSAVVKLTPEEGECEQHSVRTYERTPADRHVARLPFSSPPQNLAETREPAEDEKARHPRDAIALRRDRYVDDVVTGEDTVDDAIAVQTEHGTAGGCPLHKGAANSEDLPVRIPQEHRLQRALYVWKNDGHFTLDLRESARLLDPLGWLAPIAIEAKIHGLANAFERGYAAAVYLRVPRNGSTLHLLMTKSKAAPIQQVSLARLKLFTTTLLTKLSQLARGTLSLSTAPTFLWSDARVVTRHWVKGHASRWKTSFVPNRVSLVQRTRHEAQWRHVPGRDNPANCASQGFAPSELISNPLRWTGPTWLQENRTWWPDESDEIPDAEPSERKIVVQSAPQLTGHTNKGKIHAINKATDKQATITSDR
ncbi:uncharacterized protein [Temnothorax nylanderi]|uniref:uncharacterized protein n=1 Tax=Temnothorax nylanderi TaxID=102681 RepID=UPI003A84012E